MEKQKIARENKVVMYRKYREGDLPDIQIKHSDLITPLQALAQVRLVLYFLLWLIACEDEQLRIKQSQFPSEAFLFKIIVHLMFLRPCSVQISHLRHDKNLIQ